jgi:hypothetical protein
MCRQYCEGCIQTNDMKRERQVLLPLLIPFPRQGARRRRPAPAAEPAKEDPKPAAVKEVPTFCRSRLTISCLFSVCGRSWSATMDGGMRPGDQPRMMSAGYASQMPSYGAPRGGGMQGGCGQPGVYGGRGVGGFGGQMGVQPHGWHDDGRGFRGGMHTPRRRKQFVGGTSPKGNGQKL